MHQRGPSLIGVGEAAVYFQVTPAACRWSGQGAQAERKPPIYNEPQIEQLMAYVQAQRRRPELPT